MTSFTSFTCLENFYKAFYHEIEIDSIDFFNIYQVECIMIIDGKTLFDVYTFNGFITSDNFLEMFECSFKNPDRPSIFFETCFIECVIYYRENILNNCKNSKLSISSYSSTENYRICKTRKKKIIPIHEFGSEFNLINGKIAKAKKKLKN